MRAAVINVGDEVLAGDTVNTNASWLCTRLSENGVSVERIVVAPDDIEAIAEEVGRLSKAYDSVVVTVGLGPTPDDVTAEGVARALDLSVKVTNETRKTADGYSGDVSEEETAVPEGASLIPNIEGVVPGFVVENVFVLPGVPSEMKAVFGEIEDEFKGEEVSVTYVETDEPESELLGRIEEARNRFGVDIGSYPGDDGVRLKLMGDEEAVKEARAWLSDHV